MKPFFGSVTVLTLARKVVWVPVIDMELLVTVLEQIIETLWISGRPGPNADGAFLVLEKAWRFYCLAHSSGW